MSTIHVCPLSKLRETIDASGARHVASLINSNMEVPYPLSVPVENRLFLGMNDIVEEVPGFIPPERDHAARFINFIKNWDQSTPLVVHCWMGVSRSTAGAYIALCSLRPDADEAVLASHLRTASPEATPNKLLIQFADELLGRDGRMIRAIDRIGRGAETFEGVPFSLDLKTL